MKTICFPTDFSELSLKTFPYVIELAKYHEAEIHVVGDVSKVGEHNGVNVLHFCSFQLRGGCRYCYMWIIQF